MVLKNDPDPTKPPVPSHETPATKPPVPSHETPAAKEESAKKPAHGKLAPASEASDPEVHRLLAERQGWLSHTAYANEAEKVAREAAEHGAQDRVDEIDDQLADLGYTAK